MIKYIAIIFIDSLWIYAFFSAYIQGGEVSGLFFLFMFFSWYIFNLFCALFIADRQIDKDENKKNTPTEQDSLIKRILTFTIPKIKYVAIGIINIIFIVLIILSYIDKGVFPRSVLIALLIYDLFNLYLIVRTNKIESKEFYRILLIVCPLIFGFIWVLVA